MRIAFLAPEVAPFSGTSGVAAVAGQLPRALAERGHKLTVISPRYGTIDTQLHRLSELSRSVMVAVSDREELARFDHVEQAGVEYVFVRHEAYFDRSALYGNASEQFVDNAERFAFLCKAALGYLQETGFEADVLHLNEWQTALVPLYLKALAGKADSLKRARTVLSVHDLGAQGLFEASDFHHTNLPSDCLSPAVLEHHGKLNFLKAGLVSADAVTVQSRRYASEIQSDEFGCGLEETLIERQDALHGVLEGVSYDPWDPRTDRYLKANYTAEDRIGKRSCKADLQMDLGLDKAVDTPVVAMISRLTHDKGTDLVTEAFAKLMELSIQFVLLGAGERRYEEFFENQARSLNGRVGVRIGRNELLTHKILAGADILLMPSRFEPGGSLQLHAKRYGAVPVVRATGGLDDAVEHVNVKEGTGTGFKFKGSTPGALLKCAQQAVRMCQGEGEPWQSLVSRCMRADHSWANVSTEYERIYEIAMGSRLS